MFKSHLFKLYINAILIMNKKKLFFFIYLIELYLTSFLLFYHCHIFKCWNFVELKTPKLNLMIHFVSLQNIWYYVFSCTVTLIVGLRRTRKSADTVTWPGWITNQIGGKPILTSAFDVAIAKYIFLLKLCLNLILNGMIN